MNDYPSFLHVIELEEIDSTNSYLKKRIESLSSKLPVLVTARLQTMGRGRDTRTWTSIPGGGLYSSFGFKLKTHENFHLLSLTVGIGVIETLEEVSGLKFGLKWPNDVFFDSRKIAGILVENTISRDNIYCIAGIGINLNHTLEDFPVDIKEKATSLKIVSGDKNGYSIESVNRILSEKLFLWLEKMKRGENAEIIHEVNRLSAFLLDKPISFHVSASGEPVRGIYKGINPDGGVIVERENGENVLFYSGDLGF